MTAILTRYTDAHEFTTKSGLCRKAGVNEDSLLAVVTKELVDNALDAVEQAGADVKSVSLGLLPERNGFFVEDGAGGFSNDALLEFWRVDRGYTSSKRFRLPTRGALGNGLRVVAGAVVAFDAVLTVHTRGKEYSVQPRPEGEPAILETGDSPVSGTRIEMSFPQSVSVDEKTLAWGEGALFLSSGGRFAGKSSPHWYTSRDLYELFRATDGVTVAAVVSQFAGCSGAKAGRIAEGYDRAPANEITEEDADEILSRMRREVRVFNHTTFKRIGGETRFSTGEFVTDAGLVIPFSVSVWAFASDAPALEFALNRSPSTARAWSYRQNANTQRLVFPGYKTIDVTTKRDLSFIVNVSAPLIPYTSDGKSPDLTALFTGNTIRETIVKAANAAKRESAETTKGRTTQKDIILAAMPEALKIAGGGYSFSQRQVFYAIRPLIGFEPKYKYFTDLLTAYENEFGEVEGLYRDNRGSLIIPHTGQEIPVGTVTVARFKRPKWTFHRVLFIEKQGFFPLLKSAHWPERWDCALISSSGFASRAVKDLLDFLGEDEAEPVEVFALHDADGPGTLIFQALIEATASRGARKVRIHNLGLEPWEALEMGLPPERIERERDAGKIPVADYVPKEWRRWLQKNRVELNSMNTPQFLRWLDEKMEAAAGQPPKLIPPSNLVRAEYESKVRERISAVLAERILAEAKHAQRVEMALMEILMDTYDLDIESAVESALAGEREKSWRAPVEKIAVEMAKATGF